MTPELAQAVESASALLRRLAREGELALTNGDRESLEAWAQKLELLVAGSRIAEKNQHLDTVSAKPRAILWTDGASRGNPGHAGIGAVLRSAEGRVLATVSRYIGRATNNVAEYEALVSGLEAAQALGVLELEVRADSQLIIEQLKGNYAVKNANLKPLYLRAQALMGAFQRVELQHVPRAENQEADELANLGIDAR